MDFSSRRNCLYGSVELNCNMFIQLLRIVLYCLTDAFVLLRKTGLTGGFLLLRKFSVAISVSPHVCFYLSFNFDFYVSKIMHL